MRNNSQQMMAHQQAAVQMREIHAEAITGLLEQEQESALVENGRCLI